MIKEKYQGIRPMHHYLLVQTTEKTLTLFRLLKTEKHTNIMLTESMAMTPASSVSGLYFSHPESRYFPLGRINKRSNIRLCKQKDGQRKQLRNGFFQFRI